MHYSLDNIVCKSVVREFCSVIFSVEEVHWFLPFYKYSKMQFLFLVDTIYKILLSFNLFEAQGG